METSGLTTTTHRPPLRAEQFRELLDYHPDTGHLIWKYRPGGPSSWNTVFCGKVAGSKNEDGYLKMIAYGRTYLCHRVIWSMVHGEWPELTIDHINGVRDDNRLVNLRLATIAQNTQNARNTRPFLPDGSPGLKGANLHRRTGRWIGRIKANGKFYYLGCSATAQEAHEAYVAAGAILHGPFARPS